MTRLALEPRPRYGLFGRRIDGWTWRIVGPTGSAFGETPTREEAERMLAAAAGLVGHPDPTDLLRRMSDADPNGGFEIGSS